MAILRARSRASGATLAEHADQALSISSSEFDDEEAWSITAADRDADDAAMFFFERGRSATEEQADWLLPLLVWLTWRASIHDRASDALGRRSGFSILDLIFPG